MYTTAKHLKVYYQQAGTGAPVLFLHGWGVSGELFKPLFIHLAKQGREVRVIDFPGFGSSEPPPMEPLWGVEEYSQMVLALLDSWGLEKVDILAHSFGARVALKLAHGNPGRTGKMLLTGAAGIRRKGNVPVGKKIISRAGKLAGSFGSPGQWVKKQIYSVIGSADYLSADPVMRSILVKVVNEDLSELLPNIKNETMLVWGDKDSATPLEDGEKMNSLLRNSSLKVISNAGHYAFAEKPKQFIKYMDEFFK